LRCWVEAGVPHGVDGDDQTEGKEDQDTQFGVGDRCSLVTEFPFNQRLLLDYEYRLSHGSQIID
jgi:hypothetical protein